MRTVFCDKASLRSPAPRHRRREGRAGEARGRRLGVAGVRGLQHDDPAARRQERGACHPNASSRRAVARHCRRRRCCMRAPRSSFSMLSVCRRHRRVIPVLVFSSSRRPPSSIVVVRHPSPSIAEFPGARSRHVAAARQTFADSPLLVVCGYWWALPVSVCVCVCLWLDRGSGSEMDVCRERPGEGRERRAQPPQPPHQSLAQDARIGGPGRARCRLDSGGAHRGGALREGRREQVPRLRPRRRGARRRRQRRRSAGSGPRRLLGGGGAGNTRRAEGHLREGTHRGPSGYPARVVRARATRYCVAPRRPPSPCDCMAAARARGARCVGTDFRPMLLDSSERRSVRYFLLRLESKQEGTTSRHTFARRSGGKTGLGENERIRGSSILTFSMFQMLGSFPESINF